MFTESLGKDAVTIRSSQLPRTIQDLAARAIGRATASVLRLHRISVFVGLLFAALASPARAEIELPVASPQSSIHVRADGGRRWKQGEYDVWHLQGNCEIRQDQVVGRATEAVLWVDRASPHSGQPTKAIVYLDGEVTVEHGGGSSTGGDATNGASLTGRTWLGRFYTLRSLDFDVPLAGGEPAAKPAAFDRGMDARTQQYAESHRAVGLGVQPAQFTTEEIETPTGSTLSLGSHNIILRGRSSVRPQLKFFPNPNNAGESIGVVSSGVNILIQGIQTQSLGDLGTIDIETDRAVIWTSTPKAFNFGAGDPQTDVPVEIYLEGNIVFRQGDRVIYADRMYYDVTRENGVVLESEVLTPVPNYEGLLRLKADVLQMVSRQQFVAFGAAATSSRIGVPRYWVQSQQVTLEDQPTPQIDPITGAVAVDPVTGEPAVRHNYLATSRNNFVYLGGLPVLYWPTLATDLERPSFYINDISGGSDNIFGTQARIDFDLFQVLGIRDVSPGTDWSLSTDYLSDRGFGLGTEFVYAGEGLLQFPGPYHGLLDAWGIKDTGLDTLGADRRDLIPEEEWRGRVRFQHRHDLPNGFQFTAEAGLISDRDFLEQYFEREWDQYKDQNTGIQLKQYLGSQAWSITADVRVNDFFTQTEWLPRLDHTALGYSFLADYLTFNAHTHVGYANMKTASTPTQPANQAKFNPLPYEADREGLHAATRQEIDLPVNLGPIKIVPYALGEAFYVGEDLNGDDLTRLYGQVGIRTNLPFWTVYPTVQSTLLNLNGLAHKIALTSEVFYADADQNFDQFPLYETLDDDAQEHFRRRIPDTTFGGALFVNDVVPLRFDPRTYALRSGMQSWVTAPSTEIADDLTIARLGIEQRWQTKRGLPGAQRVVDVVSLDLEASIFPEADRDNFGEYVGLANYDFRWHIGDRFTVLSDGLVDFFPEGLRT
ncbi:MAG: LPS-assembly protein LptD, partial [Planctomycetales bacterium]|nr:LPS-assembly protein LptD [Planctomycetales bacterium]